MSIIIALYAIHIDNIKMQEIKYIIPISFFKIRHK